jgi:hypothetical protein
MPATIPEPSDWGEHYQFKEYRKHIGIDVKGPETLLGAIYTDLGTGKEVVLHTAMLWVLADGSFTWISQRSTNRNGQGVRDCNLRNTQLGNRSATGGECVCGAR